MLDYHKEETLKLRLRLLAENVKNKLNSSNMKLRQFTENTSYRERTHLLKQWYNTGLVLELSKLVFS